MRKYTRQRKILELIESKEIKTQEELLYFLKKAGIDVTQATVSRDIKELGLVKVTTENGEYKYAVVENNKESTRERLIKIFRSSVLELDVAGHIIVIKTLPGGAQICGSAIDNLEINGIIGTIAGDDTIFAAVDRDDNIENVMKVLQTLLN